MTFPRKPIIVIENCSLSIIPLYGLFSSVVTVSFSNKSGFTQLKFKSVKFENSIFAPSTYVDEWLTAKYQEGDIVTFDEVA